MFKWQQSRNSDNWCDANIVLKTKFFKYLLSEQGEKIPIESVGFQKNKNMNTGCPKKMYTLFESL